MAKGFSGNHVRMMYNHWGQRYEDEFEGYDYIAPQKVFNAAAQAVDIAAPEIKIVDVGVGTGWLSQQFRHVNANARITGLDVSEAMIALCRQKNIVDVFQRVDFQTQSIDCADNEVDVVVSSGVFELLRTLDNVISEMVRITKPDGIVAFTTMAGVPWRQRLDDFLSGSGCKVHNHRMVKRALENAGAGLIGTERFPAYNRKGLGNVMYNLYAARKL